MGFRVVPPYKVGLSGDGGQLGGVEWVPPIKWGRVPGPPIFSVLSWGLFGFPYVVKNVGMRVTRFSALVETLFTN